MTTENTMAETIGLTQTEAVSIGTLACELAENGELDAARQMLEALSMLNPRDSAVSAALGTVYQKLDLPKEADEAYTQAIDTADHQYARVYRGELRLRSGDTRGLDDLKAVMTRDPRTSTQPAMRAKAVLEARGVIKVS
jgi:thioredoxin-like negative regulator of GroEL